MPLLKRRPDVSLIAPRVIVGGEPFGVRVILRCAEPVPVDAVRVELWGEGVWRSGPDDDRRTHPFARRAARPVSERIELSAGEHELPVSFELPPNVLPSYSGHMLSIQWLVRVHVDIPWWPDARASFVVFVVPAPAARAEPPPRRVYATSAAGPQGQRPYAEVALGSTAVEPGGLLHGKVALSNTAHNDYRALRVSLVAAETVPALLTPFTQHHVVARWTVPVSEPGEGAPIELALRLPTDVVPGFGTRMPGIDGFRLEWVLEVRVDVAWALDVALQIPLVVHPGRGLEGRQVEAAAPLAVGSERLALVWGEAARRSGWTHDREMLTRVLEDVRLEVRREHQGRRGLQLRGEARFQRGDRWASQAAWEPLGGLDLGLRLEGGRLRCRDEGQARVLAEHTDDAAAQCELAEADDHRLVCLVADAGTRVEPLAQLAERLEALARALVIARQQLPAPADMLPMVPQFREAARRLGAELDVASMDLWGVRDEIPFSLQTQWDDDGILARTVLEVRPTLPVDARWHQRWSGRGRPGPMPEGLAPLADAAQGMVVAARSILLSFPPCQDELDPLVARLEGLLAVARRLSGQGLGYR